MTASCESVTEFSVTVSGNGMTTNSSVQDAASLSYMTEDLKPFQNYTATVTVMSSCGSSNQCSESFMSPREESELCSNSISYQLYYNVSIIHMLLHFVT